MKTKLFLSLLLSFYFYLLSSQVPQGFNYQAIARGSDGKEIANTTLQVKVSILSDTTGFYADGKGTYIWEEQQSVKTNSLGLFTLTVGNTLATKVQGSAVTFSAIDWKQQPLFIGTKINYTGWKNLGTSRLWTVPYAMVAGDLKNNSRVQVSGDANSTDSILFEVKNRTGQTVFAVYEEGVRIYVDDGIYKGKGKGGFAIGSFGAAKAPSQEYFRVTRDSTRIYTNPAAKGTKGGFAIGSFAPAKGLLNNYLNLTPNNYLIGQDAGKNITTGLYNNFIGYQAGYSDVDGGYNTFIGYQAGKGNLSGNSNVFVGHLAGEKNNSGTGNVFTGIYAGQDFSGGYNNTFIGTMAGQNFTNGSGNIFIGRSAGTGFNFPVGTIGGTNNISIGSYAGFYITSGGNNVMLGGNSGFYFTSGWNNLFAGDKSGYSNSSGGENVFLGSSSGYLNNTGNQNVFIGFNTGYNNQDGKFNTFIGAGAGYTHASGDRNVFIGSGSGGNLIAQSNRLYIENSAADLNSALIYGEFDNNYLRLNANTDIFGRLGVGRTAPATRLDVLGGNWSVAGASEGDFRIGNDAFRLKIGVATSGGGNGDVRITAMGGTNRIIMGGNGVDVLTIGSSNVYPWADNLYSLGLSTNRWSVVYSAGGVVTTSDIRMKSNIQDLDYGLESIMKLEPVSYTWKDGSDKNRRLGLIAQDVDKVISEVVDKGTDPAQTLGINYSELVPVLIKGMQEQQKQIEASSKENQQLRSDVNLLREEIEKLKVQASEKGSK
jgi:hypothetical protein